MIKYIITLCLLLSGISLVAQDKLKTKYYRHLAYNHVSPHVPIKGIYPISKTEADTSSHYKFTFHNDQLVEIVNHHYNSQRQHPLTTFDAYKVMINYLHNQEVRTFYDPNGKRIANERGVYKEVFTYDKKGFVTSLEFFDLEDRTMESNWGIHSYQWSKHKKMVIEKRYNLADSAVSISPYFSFGTTGIVYDKNGFPQANYNLDEQLKVVDNESGVASYQDTYDKNDNHIRYTYHNQSDELTLNQWGFAIGRKTYDAEGNQIGRAVYDVNDSLLNEREDFSNVYAVKAPPISAADSVAIKRVAMGYLIALQQLKPEIMEEVMHEQLAKRTIGWDFRENEEVLRETTYQQMIDFAESWNQSGTKFPTHPQQSVTILDAYQKAASVKLVSDNWYEYLHLAKIKGQWRIVNMFWLYKDARRNEY
ncbi:nuclear transport factor 2 family protein [Marivirga arenosa]|uniref:Nuclear transport factor 2 family protein n=1 Tax=Marivirga arenosa TaxID=3059076 RepID=A0AA49GD32_9BACT|nr:nuclear transport factor 2 family protein [Marivirga sp. BKB1-2]WKK81052.2 nuclear transport factor 2 family protein [Marivirga sp. BKB1-2]